MPHDPPIVITQSDFGLLRRLAGHPRLAAELERAVVIDSRCIAADIVTMNSRVRFEDQNTGERREVTIVFPHEANASTGSISVLTPVGTALLGLAVGQSIVWPFPDGTQHGLCVLKIIYQPEADDAPNGPPQHAKHATSEERPT
jgi:regulator of nucleoside diphosphate kinase